MKIPSKYYGIIFTISVSFIMSAALSFSMLLVNVGFTEGFIMIWFSNFLIGLAISIPVAMVAVPFARKFAGWITTT